MMGISTLTGTRPSPQPSPSGRGGTCRTEVNVLREPHKGVILQVKGGEELRRSRTLTLSPCGMPSVLDKAFKGEL
jgi:hypothetical protein